MLSILIHKDDLEEIAHIFEQKKWKAFLGDELFERWLKETFFERKRHS